MNTSTKYLDLHYESPVYNLLTEYEITIEDLQSVEKLLKLIINNNTDAVYKTHISTLLNIEVPAFLKILLGKKENLLRARFETLLEKSKTVNDLNKINTVLDLIGIDTNSDTENNIYYHESKIEELYDDEVDWLTNLKQRATRLSSIYSNLKTRYNRIVDKRKVHSINTIMEILSNKK